MRVIGDLTDLKSKSTKLLSEEPTLGDECLRRMEELQDAKFSNERKINELGLLYSKPVCTTTKYSDLSMKYLFLVELNVLYLRAKPICLSILHIFPQFAGPKPIIHASNASQ